MLGSRFGRSGSPIVRAMMQGGGERDRVSRTYSHSESLSNLGASHRRFSRTPLGPLVALRVHPVEQGGGQVVGGAVATVTSPPPPPSGPRGFLLSSFLLAQSDAVSTSLAGWRKFCKVKFLPFVQFSLSNVIDFPCPPRVG